MSAVRVGLDHEALRPPEEVRPHEGAVRQLDRVIARRLGQSGCPEGRQQPVLVTRLRLPARPSDIGNRRSQDRPPAVAAHVEQEVVNRHQVEDPDPLGRSDKLRRASQPEHRRAVEKSSSLRRDGDPVHHGHVVRAKIASRVGDHLCVCVPARRGHRDVDERP